MYSGGGGGYNQHDNRFSPQDDTYRDGGGNRSNRGGRGRYQGNRGNNNRDDIKNRIGSRYQSNYDDQGSSNSYGSQRRNYYDDNNSYKSRGRGQGEYSNNRTRPPRRGGFTSRRPRGSQRDSRFKRGGGNELGSPRSRSLSPIDDKPNSNMGSDGEWHKVTVHEGAKHRQDWLIQQLQTRAGVQFEAVKLHVIAEKVLFYIQGSDLAQTLNSLNNKIGTNSGPLSLFARPSEPPRGIETQTQQSEGDDSRPSTMEEDPTEIVQQILADCFSLENRSLRMGSLLKNESVRRCNIRGFFNNSVMTSIMLNLIGQKCSNLAGLDISNNGINNLNNLAELSTKAPEIIEIDLSGNRLSNLQELEKFRGLTSLKVLKLQNNPFCKRYRDVSDYRRDIRSVFPQLTMLDGETLSDPIIVGVTTGFTIPTSKESFLGSSDQSKGIVLDFVGSYYKVFDSGLRDDLIRGYDSKSYFSISINAETTVRRGPSLADYTRFSRNLTRVKDSPKRRQLIMRGHIDIVYLLRQLPQTQHNSESFIIDVILATHTNLVFNIWGVFQENPQNNGPTRAFSRTFRIAINGNDISIRNDQLTIHPSTNLSGTLPGRLQSRADNTPNQVLGKFAQPCIQMPSNSQIQQFPGIGQASSSTQFNSILQSNVGFPGNSFNKSTSLQQQLFGQEGNSNSISNFQSNNLFGAEFNPEIKYSQSLVQQMPMGIMQATSPTELGANSITPLQTGSSNIGLTDQDKQILLEKLCQVTRLKPDWAQTCLEQNEWNYDNAIVGFKILFESKEIPAEVFQ